MKSNWVCPAEPFNVATVAPLLSITLTVYGSTPPLTIILASPSLCPLTDSSVVLSTCIPNATGSVINKLHPPSLDAVQPSVLVTVTLYSPAGNPIGFLSVETKLLVTSSNHWYVKGPFPVTVIWPEPSERPLHDTFVWLSNEIVIWLKSFISSVAAAETHPLLSVIVTV